MPRVPYVPEKVVRTGEKRHSAPLGREGRASGRRRRPGPASPRPRTPAAASEPASSPASVAPRPGAAHRRPGVGGGADARVEAGASAAAIAAASLSASTERQPMTGDPPPAPATPRRARELRPRCGRRRRSPVDRRRAARRGRGARHAPRAAAIACRPRGPATVSARCDGDRRRCAPGTAPCGPAAPRPGSGGATISSAWRSAARSRAKRVDVGAAAAR